MELAKGNRKEPVGNILSLGALVAKRFYLLGVSSEAKRTMTRHCSSEGRTLREIVCWVQVLTKVWRVFACWALTQATDVWSADAWRESSNKAQNEAQKRQPLCILCLLLWFTCHVAGGIWSNHHRGLDKCSVHSRWPGTHQPRLLCLPLTQWWLWPTMSLFLATDCRSCASYWGLEDMRSFHTPVLSFGSDACWALGSLSWPGRG